MLARVLCWLFGHAPTNDPKGQPFSTRVGICARCGCLPLRREGSC